MILMKNIMNLKVGKQENMYYVDTVVFSIKFLAF